MKSLFLLLPLLVISGNSQADEVVGKVLRSWPGGYVNAGGGDEVEGCKCDDGRIFQLQDTLLSIKDPNARLKVIGIRMVYFKDEQDRYEKRTAQSPSYCTVELNSNTIETAPLASNAGYKLRRDSDYSLNMFEYYPACSQHDFVLDPRVKRNYEFAPNSGEELIIGRDVPQEAEAKIIATDSKDTSLSGDIIQRMGKDDGGETGIPTRFPRVHEVVVTNRVLEIKDTEGKKRKIPMGSVGIVQERGEGTMKVELFYTQKPNFIKQIFGTRLQLWNSNMYTPWGPIEWFDLSWRHPDSKRLSFSGELKEGSFISGQDYLDAAEKAAAAQRKK